MSLFFDALGHWAVGHPPTGDNQAILVGVAGIGVAGTITANPAKILIGATGTGQAGVIHAAVDKALLQAAGTGVAGIIRDSISAFLQGASGVGLAGVITPNPATGTIAGVSGTGVAGNVTVTISGGSGSRKRAGLSPPNKRPDPPKAEPEGIPLPPFRGPPPNLVPEASPPRIETPDSEFAIFEQIRRDVLDAHDQSDITRLLKQHDDDEQDIADIDAMLALLDGPQPNER